jgi:asparagine synthase (glutamine-hydrolysing)
LWHEDEPIAFPSSIPLYALARLAREHVKVVLTGEGADEILGGYPHFRRDMILYGSGLDPEEAKRRLRGLEEENAISRFQLAAEGDGPPPTLLRQLGFAPSWLEINAGRFRQGSAFFSADFISDFAQRDALHLFLAELDVPGQLRGRSPLHQSMYLWSKCLLPNYFLSVLGDRMEMAHSVEGRVPFLDHRVVEVARHVPASLKIRGSMEKYVLRQAMAPLLTDTIRERHKHPFVAPPAALQPSGPLYALVHDVLRSKAFASVPFFDAQKVSMLLDMLPFMDETTRQTVDPFLMIMTSSGVLQERFCLADSEA